MNSIEISNIHKTYRLYKNPVDRLKESLHPFRKQYHKEFHALKDVSFAVQKGETVGIIGRNGSGKSTLLKIITGVLTPSAGNVSVNGRVLALLELGSGFNPEISGFENVYFNGALMGASRGEIDQKIDDILSFADIGDFIHQPVKTYSSGMYVRLAFAVIANMDADVLIIDEALAVGDAFFTQKCMRFLRKFKENGTILFVSHDTSAVTNLCHRAIWLDHGQIRGIGSAKEISEEYLEACYAERQTVTSRNVKSTIGAITEKTKVFRDQRLDFINQTTFRNDIEIFRFNPEANSFGCRGGEITDVFLGDSLGNPLLWVVGGEAVVLKVAAKALGLIRNPIVGFVVKDKLGQTLFGDNTYLSAINDDISIDAEETFEASFYFQMPVMPQGDYSVCVALAEGTQENHIQHQWIHDALLFKSHSSSVATGLIGIPMEKITLARS
ncbi:ABC transporter ATP-binding protein [Desulfopila aestuarii]|uniref:ABC transporter ATP-binding protein n=1 Tax=Desulfopila aestuarii TaxID=231440 RepID=UPI0038995E8B